MASIKHLLIIKASPEKLYEAFTTTKGVAGWWTTETNIGSKVGDKNDFRFGEKYHNIMEITDLKANKRVEWLCEKGDKEWIGTKIIFEIEERESDCILRFSHTGWKEETDFFSLCNYHWGNYMTSIKNLCETGVGEPFSNK